jgi:hypothetical protein
MKKLYDNFTGDLEVWSLSFAYPGSNPDLGGSLLTTKHQCVIVSNSTLYLGSPSLKYQAGDQLP